MRFFSRCFLVALTSSAMLFGVQPALQAASAGKSSQANASRFAVIALANLAHVDNASAVEGTTVFPGDSLDTAPGGELRLTMARGQIYLLSDTAVRIGNSGAVLRATLIRGTVGFSSLTDRQFQILAPEGLIEAAYGLPASGRVAITGANDIVISAYAGALVLHRGAQTLIIEAGKSCYVSLVRGETPPPPKGGDGPDGHLVWHFIVVVGAGGISYWLWRTESPVDP